MASRISRGLAPRRSLVTTVQALSLVRQIWAWNNELADRLKLISASDPHAVAELNMEGEYTVSNALVGIERSFVRKTGAELEWAQEAHKELALLPDEKTLRLVQWSSKELGRRYSVYLTTDGHVICGC